MSFRPTLTDVDADGLRLVADESAAERGLRVFFTDRRGGVSSAPFDSLNLAARVGDDAERVEENRRRIAGAAGFDVARLALARQVHGARVILWGDGVVALVHAGWRGLVAGAVETGAAATGNVNAAWVGPSIHACCYEVGPEVIDAFEGRNLPVADGAHVDPGRAAAVALRGAGVEAIAVSEVCTSCDRSYFSHRRDGVTGRQGAFATLT